ncbi:S41 family peptidase [Burkholderiaceae bacterium UC74_6]
MTTRQCGSRTSLGATLALSSLLLLQACGGGGGGGGGGSSSTGGGSNGSSSVVPPPIASSTFVPTTNAQQCDSSNPDAPLGSRTGSLTIEKQWLLSFLYSSYLWYQDMPSVDPTNVSYTGSMSQLTAFNVPLPLDNYFEALKTPKLDATGAQVDKFSFTYSTQLWNSLSQSGQSYGYGANFNIVQASPPRQIIVSFVQPGTPAAGAGLVRGATIVNVDGVDVANGSNVNVLNAALLPTQAGVHTFQYTLPGSSAVQTASVGAQLINEVPVQFVKRIPTSTGDVGYLFFSDHTVPAESELIAAVQSLQGVTDLVLDIRYNGGGYLYIANELAYMIAGAKNTTTASGTPAVFSQLTYNSKWQSMNAADKFSSTSCLPDASFHCTNTGALPSLNLSTVYVLTQGDTCSASEAIINGLRGVGVNVKIIGGTTCGKPYGFQPQDNCGVTYFPIQFKNANAKGFGDYADGFTPDCPVADDYNHALGDPAEAQLATALGMRSTGSCTAASGSTVHALQASKAGRGRGLQLRLGHGIRSGTWRSIER